MSDRTDVSGSIKVLDSSVERVAFDLMKEIANLEKTPDSSNARDYYLKLFIQCRRAAGGNENALQKIAGGTSA